MVEKHSCHQVEICGSHLRSISSFFRCVFGQSVRTSSGFWGSYGTILSYPHPLSSAADFLECSRPLWAHFEAPDTAQGSETFPSWLSVSPYDRQIIQTAGAIHSVVIVHQLPSSTWANDNPFTCAQLGSCGTSKGGPIFPYSRAF